MHPSLMPEVKDAMYYVTSKLVCFAPHFVIHVKSILCFPFQYPWFLGVLIAAGFLLIVIIALIAFIIKERSVHDYARLFEINT